MFSMANSFVISNKSAAFFVFNSDKYIGMPLSKIPDPFKCHKSYAEHFEKEFEIKIKPFNFDLNFISQSKRYINCTYANEIKKALNNREKIIKILDEFREEPLRKEEWGANGIAAFGPYVTESGLYAVTSMTIVKNVPARFLLALLDV